MSKRFYPRFAGKIGFAEFYEVMDSRINEPVSPKMPYHQAANQAAERNDERFEPFQSGWLGAMNLTP